MGKKSASKKSKKYNNNILKPDLYRILLKTNTRANYDLLPASVKTSLASIKWPQFVVKSSSDPLAINTKEWAQKQLSDIHVECHGQYYDIQEFVMLYFYQAYINTIAERPRNIDIKSIKYNKYETYMHNINTYKLRLSKIINSLINLVDNQLVKIYDHLDSLCLLNKDSIFYSRKIDGDMVIELHSYRPKALKLNIDGRQRMAYPVCDYYDRSKPLELPVDAISNKIKLPVYIQNHAIKRFEERLGINYKHNFIKHLSSSIVDHKIVSKKGQHFIEYYHYGDKLGYVPVIIIKNIALIKSFKFITMVGTPEYYKLSKYIKNDPELWQYLKLDSWDTIINSNIHTHPKISKVFTLCGLDYLFKLSDEQKDGSIASALEPFLNHVDLSV
jgi:hypothetical protein